MNMCTANSQVLKGKHKTQIPKGKKSTDSLKEWNATSGATMSVTKLLALITKADLWEVSAIPKSTCFNNHLGQRAVHMTYWEPQNLRFRIEKEPQVTE